MYFDDFKVEHIKSPVVESSDYYPFGLTYNSYSRENSLANQFKFQGQEHQDELDLGWDAFKWRNYMPDIGRFFNVDPLAIKYVYNSPYAFSENHVTTHVELEGLEKVHFSVLQYNTGYTKNEGSKTGDNYGTKTLNNVDPEQRHTEVHFTLDMGEKSVKMGETFTKDNPIIVGELKNAAETGSPLGVDFEPELKVGEDGTFNIHGDLNYFGSTDVDISVKVTKDGLQIHSNVDDINGKTSVAIFAGDEGGNSAGLRENNSVLIGNTTPGGNKFADKNLNQKAVIPLMGDPSKKIMFNSTYKDDLQKRQGSTVLEQNNR